MSSGNTRLVEDLGGGKFRVTPLGTLEAAVFHETAASAADMPAASDRPPGWTVFRTDLGVAVTRGASSAGVASWGGASRLISISPTELPTKGVAMHAQDAGGAVLALVAGWTVPLPGRTMKISRSNAGPANVDYTITWSLPNGLQVVEVVTVPKNSNAISTIAGTGVVSVTTTVDPVSTSDFVTDNGFNVGVPFISTPVVAVDSVREAVAASNGASGTILATTAPDGLKAFTVLI